jgi:hypothetical protein
MQNSRPEQSGRLLLSPRQRPILPATFRNFRLLMNMGGNVPVVAPLQKERQLSNFRTPGLPLLAACHTSS